MTTPTSIDVSRLWPALEWNQWRDTADTFHRYLQIVGKTRLALTPLQNHWWNVPLYVSARGLSTSVMPLPDGNRIEIEFDFLAHELKFRSSTGQREFMHLRAQPVAKFYESYRQTLSVLGVDIAFNTLPVECPDPIRFEEDTLHRSYDAYAVHRFWQVVSRADALLKRFSGRFHGKVSPVHFFWGSFDLAVTRFSGRRAPPRAGADSIQREAYSHECISAGFWPGNGGYGRAAFYAYAAPVPGDLATAPFKGPGHFNVDLGEFLLDYDLVVAAADPDRVVLEFLQNTYETCAGAAHWDRHSLDRPG